MLGLSTALIKVYDLLEHRQLSGAGCCALGSLTIALSDHHFQWPVHTIQVAWIPHSSPAAAVCLCIFKDHDILPFLSLA